MASDKEIAALAEVLESFTSGGIYAARLDGGVVRFDGRIVTTLAEIESITAAFDDPLRTRIQSKLGLGPFKDESRGHRYARFAKTFADRPNAANRADRTDYGSLSRADQKRALLLLATALLVARGEREGHANDADQAAPDLGPYDRWEVLEYELHHAFPRGTEGEGVATHTRLIKSKVEGLRKYRVTQRSNWSSGRLPSYQLLTEGELRLENIRIEPARGVPGHRFDLVIEHPPMGIGDVREIRWVRKYEFAEGDLGEPHYRDSIDLSPIVDVKHARMTVKFGNDLLPSRVWSFSNVPALDRLELPKSLQFLPLIDGFVSAEFREPRIGYSVGIGWEW